MLSSLNTNTTSSYRYRQRAASSPAVCSSIVRHQSARAGELLAHPPNASIPKKADAQEPPPCVPVQVLALFTPATRPHTTACCIAQDSKDRVRRCHSRRSDASSPTSCCSSLHRAPSTDGDESVLFDTSASACAPSTLSPHDLEASSDDRVVLRRGCGGSRRRSPASAVSTSVYSFASCSTGCGAAGPGTGTGTPRSRGRGRLRASLHLEEQASPARYFTFASPISSADPHHHLLHHHYHQEQQLSPSASFKRRTFADAGPAPAPAHVQVHVPPRTPGAPALPSSADLSYASDRAHEWIAAAFSIVQLAQLQRQQLERTTDESGNALEDEQKAFISVERTAVLFPRRYPRCTLPPPPTITTTTTTNTITTSTSFSRFNPTTAVEEGPVVTTSTLCTVCLIFNYMLSALM